MSDKKYWQSFAELNDKGEFQKRNNNEFKEELPFEDIDGKGWLDAKAPRRDFLKYLGFSTAAATLAASCEMPVRKAIPYVNRPENVTPGVAKYYATTYVQDGDVLPIIAKVRDGRPIKIEGNAALPIQNKITGANLKKYQPTINWTGLLPVLWQAWQENRLYY
jgi:molybdopterin-containing oxidoreductase family iron-sulfur binding subunit